MYQRYQREIFENLLILLILLVPLILFIMTVKLVLQDDSEFDGVSFGADVSVSGEMVFATGMTGYPEAFTDPSFAGQILILTYPIIGSYGVPDKSFWESDRLHISGLIVSDYIDTPSHFQSRQTLAQWLKKEGVPGLEIKDTRSLAQKLRANGAMLGKIVIDKDVAFHDPNTENLVAKVSTKKIIVELPRLNLEQGSTLNKPKTVVLIDCGAKKNIARCLVRRGVNVITVPWDFDIFAKGTAFDAIIISNGPGDPKMADITIQTVKTALAKKIPTLGICLGNQILALAAGGDTSKMKFGHRSQNQPALHNGSKRCYITTQNHGFHVSKVPPNFEPWFTNANDGTNEGIRHKTLPFMSVQFHPEATPGPTDTEWIFDFFLKIL